MSAVVTEWAGAVLTVAWTNALLVGLAAAAIALAGPWLRRRPAILHVVCEE